MAQYISTKQFYAISLYWIISPCTEVQLPNKYICIKTLREKTKSWQMSSNLWDSLSLQFLFNLVSISLALSWLSPSLFSPYSPLMISHSSLSHYFISIFQMDVYNILVNSFFLLIFIVISIYLSSFWIGLQRIIDSVLALGPVS